jgi:type VI secretion system protein ImpA
MVEAGLAALAHPILETLIETIDEKKLADWEAGPLVAHPLALMCRVLDRLDIDAGDRKKYYLRVCRLDPLQAIPLQPRAEPCRAPSWSGPSVRRCSTG